DEGDLVAAIGPHIQGCCFEVDYEVGEALATCSTAWTDALIENHGVKPRVDLRKIVRAHLEAHGVAPVFIDDAVGCTCCEPQRFLACRRDGARSGRLLSAIVSAPR